jgi:hypothetical protein
VVLPSDNAAIRARRIVRRLLREEASGSAAAEPAPAEAG